MIRLMTMYNVDARSSMKARGFSWRAGIVSKVTCRRIKWDRIASLALSEEESSRFGVGVEVNIAGERSGIVIVFSGVFKKFES
jgi:hypothetical protein